MEVEYSLSYLKIRHFVLQGSFYDVHINRCKFSANRAITILIHKLQMKTSVTISFAVNTLNILQPNNRAPHCFWNNHPLLANQYLSMGKFLRKTSLDEIPQIFNIFVGQMSIIGPRPALWNQYDLLKERDKYGANDVRPGLTGWAQINGRDELEIDVKARYDGEYVQKLSFLFDVKCFFGTIFSVLRSDGVVEGGTGQKDSSKGTPTK